MATLYTLQPNHRVGGSIRAPRLDVGIAWRQLQRLERAINAASSVLDTHGASSEADTICNEYNTLTNILSEFFLSEPFADAPTPSENTENNDAA